MANPLTIFSNFMISPVDDAIDISLTPTIKFNCDNFAGFARSEGLEAQYQLRIIVNTETVYESTIGHSLWNTGSGGTRHAYPSEGIEVRTPGHSTSIWYTLTEGQGSLTYGQTYKVSVELTYHRHEGYEYSEPWTEVVYAYFTTILAGPDKSTNPDPIDEATLDGCYDRIFGWSIDVEVDTYAFYIGSSPGSLVLLDDTIIESTYTVSEENFPTGGTVYWRVDATNEGGTTTGDEWFFDPMPSKPDNPTPTDETGNVSRYQSRIYWDAGKLSQSWNVYFGPTGSMVLVESGVTTEYWDTDTELPLDASTQYSWRIDAVNVNGTITGDVWTFTTGLSGSFAPPGSTTGTWTDAGGSWTYYTGENFLCITNRLVALGNNMLYYESLGS